MKKHLLRAINHCGGTSNLARAAGLKNRQVIDNALRRGSVSPELALAIEIATGGVVTKEVLVWGDLPNKKKPVAPDGRSVKKAA